MSVEEIGKRAVLEWNAATSAEALREGDMGVGKPRVMLLLLLTMPEVNGAHYAKPGSENMGIKPFLLVGLSMRLAAPVPSIAFAVSMIPVRFISDVLKIGCACIM